MPIKLSRILLLGVAFALAAAPAAAQAPDCTGISDVSDFDGSNVSDFDGQLTTVRVASGLYYPLFVTSPPGDLDRLFIVEQDGLIKILRDGVVLPTAFIDLTEVTYSPDDGGGTEEGLLGLAFHPDYAENGWFFVYHTTASDPPGHENVVARYTVSANPDVADPDSRVEVIEIDHASYADQNGGMLAFSPLDGYLYVGSGDGGGDCDPSENAQDLQSNNGKLLRLNVDSLPYSTTGNPYDGSATGNDEIWSYGLRNPWRFSFDRITGKLLVGDVGESVWEEIDCQSAASGGAENYGWNAFEGTVCPSPSATCTNPPSCFGVFNKTPIRTYSHATDGFSCSVTAGYVYRGCRMSDLHGSFFYADYCSNKVRSFRVDDSCVITSGPEDLDRTADLDPGGGQNIWQIVSFGEDERGELYLTDIFDGEIFKILPVLGIMLVSGTNAPPLQSEANGDWVWEDLEQTSGHPISTYKVYRADDERSGPFDCVHQGGGNRWVGGDPESPDSDEVFYYLVTALNAAGEETRPGSASDGTPRNVDTGSACP